MKIKSFFLQKYQNVYFWVNFLNFNSQINAKIWKITSILVLGYPMSLNKKNIFFEFFEN